MQLSLTTFATAGIALAAAVPVPIPRAYTSPDACVCPWAGKERGENIAQSKDWYQCAYLAGACTWNVTGPLISIGQSNCAQFASCITGPRD